MKNFVIALISIVLHKAITQALSISYNFLTAPFDLGRLLVDLLAFAVVYGAVAFLYTRAARRRGALRRPEP